MLNHLLDYLGFASTVVVGVIAIAAIVVMCWGWLKEDLEKHQ